MSACISRHGEYSSHVLDPDYICTLCGVLDEEALIAELHRLRANQPDGGFWTTLYGLAPFIQTEDLTLEPINDERVVQRRVWYGPVEPIGEVTECGNCGHPESAHWPDDERMKPGCHTPGCLCPFEPDEVTDD